MNERVFVVFVLKARRMGRRRRKLKSGFDLREGEVEDYPVVRSSELSSNQK